METVCFSETLASTDKSTRHQNPEEHHYLIFICMCKKKVKLSGYTPWRHMGGEEV
jgi:hypothetical protein